MRILIMSMTHIGAALGWAVWFAMAASAVQAGDGHDHGEAPVAVGGPALPRFTAVSETFELVGVVNGRHITLYLDRYADGSPVKDASLELELGGVKVPVEAHAEGEFEATLAQALKPGVVSVAATVIAGEETDLLAGELDLHEAPDEHVADGGSRTHDWKEYVLWGGGAGAGLLVLGWLARRLRASRKARLGGAA
jgi:hypothetical protein